MSYHITKTIIGSFDQVREKVTESLRDVGFGVITEINLKEKLKEKLDVDYKPYVILGACNPGFAYEAVQIEEELGVLLPCNVVIIDMGEGNIQVSAVDAGKMMSVVKNKELDKIADTVNERLRKALESL